MKPARKVSRKLTEAAPQQKIRGRHAAAGGGNGAALAGGGQQRFRIFLPVVVLNVGWHR
jgi:hypothetical protein